VPFNIHLEIDMIQFSSFTQNNFSSEFVGTDALNPEEPTEWVRLEELPRFVVRAIERGQESLAVRSAVEARLVAIIWRAPCPFPLVRV
jgi:hypothetical protein